MSPRLALAIDAAIKAGRSTLALFQTGAPVDFKGDASPVTQADRRAEEILRAEIERAFPGDSVLGEEQGLIGASDDRWVLDPIDGTKSFVAGVPLYSTLVSYEQAGVPVLGVIYFPALDELHYAERGCGAFMNGRPSRVSSKSALAESVVCTAGHKGISRYGFMNGVVQLSEQVMATRTWCDAYGHMLVASGRAEAMLDPIVSRWDISAVIPIVEEAGGQCSGFGGSSALQVIHEGGEHELVSTNRLLHEEILGAFKD